MKRFQIVYWEVRDGVNWENAAAEALAQVPMVRDAPTGTGAGTEVGTGTQAATGTGGPA